MAASAASPEERAAIADPATVRSALRAGQVVAVPTETVTGLSVRAGDPAAAARLDALKGSAPRPYTLHLGGLDELARLLPAPPPGLARWLSVRMPGPLTVVVPSDWTALPREWNWSWPRVAMRVPAHPFWKALAEDWPGPLLATSANGHGEPPLHGAALGAWLAARPEIVVALDAAATQPGTASAVVAFEPAPRLLRGALATGEPRLGLRVLVVCSGNICRSPIGAALLEREIAAAWGLAPAALAALGWHFGSAGSFAMPGAPASENSVRAAAEQGLDLGGHRAQHVEDALAGPWDLILGMGTSHLHAVAGLLRAESAPALELFDPRGEDVPDPFGGDLPTYQAMRDHLVRCVEERVRVWSRWPPA
ncbi:MAG TPA: Sua5/YciO/YrdC/YwlC family protein [Planctomycetota bacterium]